MIYASIHAIFGVAAEGLQKQLFRADMFGTEGGTFGVVEPEYDKRDYLDDEGVVTSIGYTTKQVAVLDAQPGSVATQTEHHILVRGLLTESVYAPQGSTYNPDTDLKNQTGSVFGDAGTHRHRRATGRRHGLDTDYGVWRKSACVGYAVAGRKGLRWRSGGR